MNKVKRQPVLVGGSVAGVISLGVIMLVNMNVLNWTPEQVESFNGFIVPAVALLLPIAGAYLARRKVTPVADPRMANGAPARLIAKQ